MIGIYQLIFHGFHTQGFFNVLVPNAQRNEGDWVTIQTS